MKASHLWSTSVTLVCTIAFGCPPRSWVSAVGLTVESPRTTVSYEGGGTVVKKSVFSDKIRFVFVMGLEGAGHHYVTGAIQEMFDKHPELPRARGKFEGFRTYFIPSIMGRSSAFFQQAQQDARNHTRDFSERNAQISYPGTFIFFGGQSIPTGNGPTKVMQYVDPRLMAEAAEATGADFRILYLKRPAKQILLADTVHRHFEKYLSDPGAPPVFQFMEAVRITFTDVAVVQSFLAELDPAFVVCHDWGLFGDRDQGQAIGDAIAPNSELASLVGEALVDAASAGAKHSADEMHPLDEDDALSSRIQRKLDSFEGLYCGHQST